MKRPRVRAGGFYFSRGFAREFRGYAAPALGSTKPTCYAGYRKIVEVERLKLLRRRGRFGSEKNIFLVSLLLELRSSLHLKIKMAVINGKTSD